MQSDHRKNLFEDIPVDMPEEIFNTLQTGNGFKLERIVSQGHVTPSGNWYDQDDNEWILLLSGETRIRFENSPKPVRMRPGDYINIPAHVRHRVEWTAPETKTVWLALHYR